MRWVGSPKPCHEGLHSPGLRVAVASKPAKAGEASHETCLTSAFAYRLVNQWARASSLGRSAVLRALSQGAWTTHYERHHRCLSLHVRALSGSSPSTICTQKNEKPI